jgi:hypothetical protein
LVEELPSRLGRRAVAVCARHDDHGFLALQRARLVLAEIDHFSRGARSAQPLCDTSGYARGVTGFAAIQHQHTLLGASGCVVRAGCVIQLSTRDACKVAAEPCGFIGIELACVVRRRSCAQHTQRF